LWRLQIQAVDFFSLDLIFKFGHDHIKSYPNLA
jgi:hypothetical protein